MEVVTDLRALETPVSHGNEMEIKDTRSKQTNKRTAPKRAANQKKKVVAVTAHNLKATSSTSDVQVSESGSSVTLRRSKRTRKSKNAGGANVPELPPAEPKASGISHTAKNNKSPEKAASTSASPEPQTSQPGPSRKSRPRKAKKSAKISASTVTPVTQTPEDEAIDVSQPAKKAKTSLDDPGTTSNSELEISKPGSSRVLRSSKKNENTHSDLSSTPELLLSEPGPSGVSRSTKNKTLFVYAGDSPIPSLLQSPELETSDESLFSSTDEDSMYSVSSSDEVKTGAKGNSAGNLHGHSSRSRLSKLNKRRKLNPPNTAITDSLTNDLGNPSLIVQDHFAETPANNNVPIFQDLTQPSTSTTHPTLSKLLQARARFEMQNQFYRQPDFLRDYISNTRRQELAREYLRGHPEVNEEQILYTYFGDLIKLSNRRKPICTVQVKATKVAKITPTASASTSASTSATTSASTSASTSATTSASTSATTSASTSATTSALTTAQELQLLHSKLQRKTCKDKSKAYECFGVEPLVMLDQGENFYKFVNESHTMRVNMKKNSNSYLKKDKKYNYVEYMNMINELMNRKSMQNLWLSKGGASEKSLTLSKKSKDKVKTISENKEKVFAGQYGYITKEYAGMVSRALPYLSRALNIRDDNSELKEKSTEEDSIKVGEILDMPVAQPEKVVADKCSTDENIETMTDLSEQNTVTEKQNELIETALVQLEKPDNAHEILNNRFKRYVLRISNKVKEMNTVIGELLTYHSKKKKLAATNNKLSMLARLNTRNYDNLNNVLGNMYLTISNNISILREALDHLEFFINMEKYKKFYEKPKLNIPVQFDSSLLLAITEEIFHPPLALYVIGALNVLTIQKEVMALIEGVYIIRD